MNKKLIEEFLKLVVEDLELISTADAHEWGKGEPVEIEKSDKFGGRVEKQPSRPQTIDQLKTAFIDIIKKYGNNLTELGNMIFGAFHKKGDITEFGDNPKDMRKPVKYNTEIAQALLYLLKIWKLDRKTGNYFVSKLITLLDANKDDTKNITGWDKSIISQSNNEFSARELNPIEPHDVRNFLKLFEIHSDPQRARASNGLVLASKTYSNESLIQEAFDRHNIKKIIRDIIKYEF